MRRGAAILGDESSSSLWRRSVINPKEEARSFRKQGRTAPVGRQQTA